MRPTPRALLLAFAGLPLALLPAFGATALWPLWVAWIGGILLLLGADLVMAMPRWRIGNTCAVTTMPMGVTSPAAAP